MKNKSLLNITVPEPEHQGIKRAPLARMNQIYIWLQNQELPNCSRIAAEFEVDRRTALRDIEFMRDRMRLPVEFDAKRNGYHFSATT